MKLTFFSYIIKAFWIRSANDGRLNFGWLLFFWILCSFEYLYRFGFFLVQYIKKFFGCKSVLGCRVVSVGNLSVGGTGKTVFVEFLAKQLGVNRSAIISRGYGAKNTKDNILVSNGQDVYSTPDICGDEPYMLAKSLKITTVVGANRYKSCLIIQRLFPYIKFFIFDDGYQNYQVNKNFNILIVDARYPLGFNGHCLPAGNLRESDYSRANLIVVTHSDTVSTKQIDKIKNYYFCDFDPNKILFGKYKPIGLFQSDVLFNKEFFSCKKFLLVAGIGSFSGFLNSVKIFGIDISNVLEFSDHHSYSVIDVKNMLSILFKNELDGIIVTSKDWVKLSKIIPENCFTKFFIFKIEFEFLSQAQYSSFQRILSEELM